MLKYKNIRILLIAYLLASTCIISALQTQPNKTADLIIFSFHRPMQLYALLETVFKYFSKLNKIYVLYRTDTQEYEAAYQEIQATFPRIQFVKQGINPRADFKPLLLQCFYGSSAEYVCFAVDDDIVKDYVNIHECVQALEKTDAYGFYLRLGTNICRQYYDHAHPPVPPHAKIKNDILKYQFKNGTSDWRYPHTVDMTIFKKSKIEYFYKNENYTSPNTLESAWVNFADLNQYGLFFKISKMFTLPLNIVQQDWWCPNENSFSVEDLFIKWKNGLKIDIRPFDQIMNNCTFMGYRPNFIPRK